MARPPGWLHAKVVAAVLVAAGVGSAGSAPARGQRQDGRPPAAAGERLQRYRDGVARFAEGDYPQARRLLRPLAEAPLRSRDTLLYHLAASEAAMVPPERAEALAHFRRLVALPDSRYHALARARVADLLYELGRDGEAAAAYRALLSSTAPEIDLAVAHFRLGEMAARRGQQSEALASWRQVFVGHPAHPLAARALERIGAALPAGDPRAQPTVEQRLERARRLVAEHGWQLALDELAAVPADVAPPMRDEADYQIGMTHFKMRHGYDIAAAKLLDVWRRLPPARQADALFHGARALSRIDEDDRAIAGYRQVVELFPSSAKAREAAFLIGWLDFNRGRYGEAMAALERLAAGARSPFTDDAVWFAAFSRWLTGDAAGALVGFEHYDRLATGALGDGKARYWRARALDQLGRRDEAVAELSALVGSWPMSYYAQQARVRLGQWGRAVGPFGSRPPPSSGGPRAVSPVAPALAPPVAPPVAQPVAAPVAPPVASPGASIDARVAADPRVARVDELIAVGLPVEAAAELARVDDLLLRQYGGARALPLLIDRYLRSQDYFHVHRLGEAHAGGALRRDPGADVATRRSWELIYPLAYRRLVERYAPSGNNPTYYLYAIMQKESAYNPHDLSYADAIGLLQMIPPTSRRVGQRIGRPYTADVLYDPEGNIQFGAWYIGHLLEKFKGQIALGAGSYNAGPRAMMRWLSQHGHRPLDEFIELCPYTQTREYMKKALEIYARYLWLYQQRDYLPDEHVDAAWLDDGIDY